MLQLKNIRKAYKTDDFTQVALDDVSVTFRDSEFVAILGPSGSGKTTMLNILGGLDHADSGEIVINGVSTRDYSSKDWDTYRNHRVGFVFQSYNLIPHQTVLSNVELALTLAGVGRAERRRRATEALAAVGLADHVRKRPAQLSGGQMQRVAIARALVNDPDIVLADEPTGALDTDTGIQVMNILRDVARDRLVVMVTHNPELAESYATRIVRVRDGRIVDDSDPIRDGEPEAASFSPAGDAAQAPLSAGRTGEKDKGGRASMGFLTALSLSFNNLMTKKGRTFMTAFAGSIGIIGIAAILALSNGVNHYIARTEEGALSSYPLTITKSSFDFSKLMGYGMSDSGTGASSGKASGAKRAKGSDDIPQRAIVTDMFAQVKSNDLGSFKTYLDAHRKKVGRYANAVEYDYDVTPQIYMTDTSKGVTRLNPSSVASTLQGGVMGSALTGKSSSSGTFTQLVSDERLLRSNMSLVRGTWPKAADEAVLVLNRKGEVSDYTLYGIGFYDPQSMQKMTDAALGGQKVEVSRKDRRDFTYDDALGMTFSVVPSANLYQKNDAQGTWTDMSEDEAYMRQQVQNGIKLRIVGVIRPKGDAQSGLVKEGVAYTPALTQELMRRAASSQIVREQQARRDVDVFTGKTFEELQQSQESFDMRKMFTVDQDALKRAFTIDTSAVTAAAGGLDSSALDLSGISLDQAGFDPSAMTLDTSALDNVLSADTVEGILKGIEPFSAYAEKNGLTLTDEQNQAVDKASTALVTGYLTWRQGVAEGADSSWGRTPRRRRPRPCFAAEGRPWRRRVRKRERAVPAVHGLRKRLRQRPGGRPGAAGGAGHGHTAREPDVPAGERRDPKPGHAALRRHIAAGRRQDGRAFRRAAERVLRRPTGVRERHPPEHDGGRPALAFEQLRERGQAYVRLEHAEARLRGGVEPGVHQHLPEGLRGQGVAAQGDRRVQRREGRQGAGRPEDPVLRRRGLAHELRHGHREHDLDGAHRVRVHLARGELHHDRHHHVHIGVGAQEGDWRPARHGRLEAERRERLQRGDRDRGPHRGRARHRGGAHRAGSREPRGARVEGHP
jgi:ABC-type lipoprotein export system ATPase subunit